VHLGGGVEPVNLDWGPGAYEFKLAAGRASAFKLGA